MNKQREAVYGLRRGLIEGGDQKDLIVEEYVANILGHLLDEHAPEKVHPDQWQTETLFQAIYDVFGARLEGQTQASDLNRSELGDAVYAQLRERYEVKEQILGAPNMRYHERIVMLSVLDGLWKEHLLAMDHLKEGIGLRGYAQQDPLVAYKKESYDMFEAMMSKFQEDTARNLFRMQILGPDGQPIETRAQLEALQGGKPASAAAGATIPAPLAANRMPALTEAGHETYPSEPPNSQPMEEAVAVPAAPVIPTTTNLDGMERELEMRKARELALAHSNGNGSSAEPKRVAAEPGRNEDCFCGSGKKYKKCHGAVQA